MKNIRELLRDQADDLVAQLSLLQSEGEILAALKGKKFSRDVLSVAFAAAADKGYLMVVKCLSTLDEVDPAYGKNLAFRSASESKRLEVVEFLASLDKVDPTAENHAALRSAGIGKQKDVFDCLIALPCYNPFTPGLGTDKRNDLLALYTGYELDAYLIEHQIKAQKKIREDNIRIGLFFQVPSNFDALDADINKVIKETAYQSDCSATGIKL